MVTTVVWGIPHAVATWLNLPGKAPFFPYANNVLRLESETTTALRGMDGILINATYSLTVGVVIGLIFAAIILIARLPLRRDWIAALVLGLIVFMMYYARFAPSGVRPVFGVTSAALTAAVTIFVLFRFGILGLAVALITELLIESSVIT